jgi:predicted GNAT superfamily acetyltransferase
MNYRVLEHVSEFEEAVSLEIAVWGLDPRDAVPLTMLRAVAHGGGLVNGAFNGDQMIGLALAFPARSGDKWLLWSHMTGVLPGYQGSGVGFELKQRQREWALAHDFDEIHWTFDPLQRGNANFNLHLLGTTAEHYHVNFYGVMSDNINKGELPSDRLEVIWRLKVSECPQPPAPDCPYLLANYQGVPVSAQLDLAQPEVLAQIPPRLSALDLAAQGRWRIALREALMQTFDAGYTAVDFTGSHAYLLRHS